MKIIRLDLKAFGCFTDASLDFSADGGAFHVIYGSNEAGKSTALRAVTGLFYGIPDRASDDFRHEARNLRIAAELLRANGQRATWTRRKGRRDTLTDENGKLAPESVMREFLGGASEEIFNALFHLNHQALTQGGKELSEGKGSLAESLFQVGAGIVGLRQTLKTIDEECGKLFKARGSEQLINKAIANYDAACKEARERSIAPRVYHEKLEQLNAQKSALTALEKQIAAQFIEKSRLERFQLAFPAVTRRHQILLERATLGQVALLAESASRDRENAQNQRNDARERREITRQRIRDLQDNLNRLVVSQELLAQSENIVSLYERLDSFRQAARDLPSARAQQRQEQFVATANLRELRPDLSLEQSEQIESLRLSETQINRVRYLTEQFTKLDERRQIADAAVETAEHDLRDAQQRLEKALIPPDSTSLEKCVDRVRSAGDLEQAWRSSKSELRSAETQIAQEAQRLPGWSGALEQFEVLPLPAMETIERFENDFARLDNEQKRLDEQFEKTRQQIAKLSAALNALRLSGSAPTEQELIETRAHRDQRWRDIRQALLFNELDANQKEEKTITVRASDKNKLCSGNAEVIIHHRGTEDTEIKRERLQKTLEEKRSLADAYETDVNQTDTISDRLRREAEQVAKQAGWLAEKQSGEQYIEELSAAAQKLLEQRLDLERRWEDIWRPSGVQPQSPREMRAWLTRYKELLAQARLLREKRQTNDILQQRVNELSEELSDALKKCGAPEREPQETLSALLQRASACCQQWRKAQESRERLDVEVRRLFKECDKAIKARNKASKSLADLETQRLEAIAPLNLTSARSPGEASSALDKLTALFNARKAALDLEARARQMETHIAQFQSEVKALVDSLAPELRDFSADLALIKLHTTLNQAIKDQTRRQTLEKQLNEQQNELKQAETSFERAQQKLNNLLRAAQCDDEAALEAAERKSERARSLERDLSEVEKHLAGFAAGGALEKLLQEIAELNADEIPSRHADAQQQLAELESQRAQLIGDKRATQDQIKAMDGSDQAAAAAEMAQSALAGARVGAERYIRLRLAGAILRQYLERFREQNQDPIVSRAGDFFARLTLGSFVRLKIELDDKDRPILLGARQNGEEVGVDGMSDGARDQLFLALRIASLEQQLAISEPLPFIMDDILINFDDQRAKAALRIFAELSNRMQLLLFTHHRRVRDLAQEMAMSSALKIHDLANGSG